MDRLRSRLPRIPVLKKCFCLPLHSGILIFGYFNLVLSGVVLPKLLRRFVWQVSGNLELPRTPLALDSASEEVNPDALDLTRQAVTVLWITIDIALSVLLLVATHTNKPRLMKVYLVLGAALQGLTLATDIAFYEFDDHYDNFVYFFFNGMNVYLLYMVYSYVSPHSGPAAAVPGVRYKPQQDELPIV